MPGRLGSGHRLPMRRRLVGLYALTLMERDGPLHGYALSGRISHRTLGSWRPGPGAVYPSLRRLVEHGLARARTSGRRRIYSITPSGRALLARLRRERAGGRRPNPDLSALWAEVLGSTDTGSFLVERLRATLASLEIEAARVGLPPERAGRLASAVRTELVRALPRWKRPVGRGGRAPRPRTEDDGRH